MSSKSISCWNDPTVMSLLFPNKNCPNITTMKRYHWKQVENYVPTTSNSHPPPMKHLKTDYDCHTGTIPLIVACQLGELDAVKRIVEFWGVDVCASAKYFFDLASTTMSHHFIENASPLFVAAHHGHDQIVRYLLEKGADASAKTSSQNFLEYDGLSPLYGAVWVSPSINLLKVPSVAQLRRERSVIVGCLLEADPNPVADSSSSSSGRPIWMNKLCGADSIIELINHGLDLNLRDPKIGGTLLHNVGALTPSYFAEDDLLVIAKLLVDKGVDLLAQDNQGFTPILRAANFNYDRPNFGFLDHLLELNGINRIEKIDALELAGATILSKPKYAPHFPKAFEYWRRAHHLRQMEKESSCSSAEKILGPKKGGIMEWSTLSQLEHVIQHPKEYKIQSLLVTFRVLSGRSWEAVDMDVSACYSLLVWSVNHNITTFVQRLEIGLVALNTICRFNPREKIRGLHFEFRERTVSVVNHLIDILQVETSSILNTGHPYATLLPFESYETSLDLILLALNHLNPDNFYEIRFHSLFDLLAVMFCLPGMLLEESHRNSIIQLLRERVGSYRLGFILLQACEHTWNKRYLAIIRLLLEAGADPNVGLDRTGDAPLHLVAGLEHPKLNEAAASLLVESGAHLDRVNKAGKTAADVWIESRNQYRGASGWNARPDWCRTVPNLLCIAARSVRVHHIPYKKTTPATLHSFVAMH